MAIDPHNRPVRIINEDTTNEELEAGHIIPGASPPTNEDARGGFGNRDGKQGYGTDSSDGISAVSVNEDADKTSHPADNMRTAEEGADQRANQDLPSADYMDPRRVATFPDEIEADDRRPTDEMEDADSRVGMGQMEQTAVDPSAAGATPNTNADLLDRNAQESGLEL